MRIGGSNDWLMIVGPVIACALIVVYAMDLTDLLRHGDRMLYSLWTMVMAALRR